MCEPESLVDLSPLPPPADKGAEATRVALAVAYSMYAIAAGHHHDLISCVMSYNVNKGY